MSELQSDLLEYSANRASLYELLGSLYLLELTAPQVDRFRHQDFDLLKGVDPHIDEGLASIKRYFKASAGSDARTELATDYAHSVLGATADERRMALPYESVFTSEEGLLMQSARDDVYRLYCAEHLGTPEGLDIPEDHLGLMFEFMAHLCRRYNDALLAGDLCEAHRLACVQQEMLVNHIANWIDEYCDVLADVSRTDFYKGLSQITRGWVKLEVPTVAGVIADTEDVSALFRTEPRPAV